MEKRKQRKQEDSNNLCIEFKTAADLKVEFKLDDDNGFVTYFLDGEAKAKNLMSLTSDGNGLTLSDEKWDDDFVSAPDEETAKRVISLFERSQANDIVNVHNDAKESP